MVAFEIVPYNDISLTLYKYRVKCYVRNDRPMPMHYQRSEALKTSVPGVTSESNFLMKAISTEMFLADWNTQQHLFLYILLFLQSTAVITTFIPVYLIIFAVQGCHEL